MTEKTYKKFWWGFARDLIISTLAISAFFISVAIFTYLYFSKDLATKNNLVNRNDTGLILLDRNGKPFFNFYSAKIRKEVPLSEISLHMQHAVIASEDREFYTHDGISIRGIARSIYQNLVSKDLVSGGSTI